MNISDDECVIMIESMMRLRSFVDRVRFILTGKIHVRALITLDTNAKPLDAKLIIRAVKNSERLRLIELERKETN